MLHAYWRERFDDSAKKIYDKMLSAFYLYKEKVSCGNLAPETIREIYIAVCNDHPELYHLPYNLLLQTVEGMFGSSVMLIIENIFSADQIRSMNRQIDTVCRDLSARLSDAKTDNEKETCVCEYLISNTVYAVDNLYNQNAAIVICNHRGQCSGIAKATKLILDYLGIETIVVHGTANDADTGVVGPHAWNIVKTDGKYYHLDVTFMIGGNTPKNKPYRFFCYNCSDEVIRKDHAWNESSTPKCQGTLNPINSDDIIGSAEIVISSLFELRKCLKEAMLDGKHRMVFESRIQLSGEKLIAAIRSCCRDVAASLGCAVAMKISFYDSDIEINW